MHAADVIVSILRDAWGALIAMILAIGGLAMLYQFLKAVGSATIGASMIMGRAIESVASAIIVILYAFLAVPAIVHAVSGSISIQSCGPAAQLGEAAAYVMAGITAVRMARAAFISLFSAYSGSESGMAYAVSETGEAIFGMLLITIAVPVAAAFLGVC